MDHVKTLFCEWHGGALSPERRALVERHLGACGECGGYYREMSGLLEGVRAGNAERLAPDPFAPARIGAIAAGTAGAVRRPLPFIRVSLAVVMVTLALGLGVYLGEGLAPAPASGGKAAMTNAYYNALTQPNFESNLSGLTEGGGKTGQ